MEISYRGANCIVIKSKGATLVIDPTNNVKVNELNKDGTVVLATQGDFAPKNSSAFVIDMPGEYERDDVSIKGIAMKRNIDPEGKNATLYTIDMAGTKIAVMGHITAPIEDDVLEEIGMVDIVAIPVGGGGYTLDARDAASVVRQISPKIVIPTHYADSSIKYEVPQEPVDQFVKELGGAHEKTSSLKLKNNSMPEVITVYVITRS